MTNPALPAKSQNEFLNCLSDDQTSSGLALAPLVIDLDGTLTPTDTLYESVIQVVKQSPLNLLRLPFWLLNGRAAFKDEVTSRVSISAERLPYREALLNYLRSEKGKGRRIVLATAANRAVADRVAAHLGLFDDVLASDSGCNLKGKAKLEAIQENVGSQFVYAGDSSADLPIWNAAQAAILVAVSSRICDSVSRVVPIEQVFPRTDVTFATWLRALRVHQWLKNLLLVVPLLTAFSFMEVHKLTTLVVALMAFSFLASATYIINDLCDLESDRTHPRKRLRPFASATIPILNGLAVAGILLLLALVLALAVSLPFFLVLLIYLTLTSAYNWMLKEYVLIDVVMLSILYTLRILAGSVAIDVPVTSWLLAFSVFIFLSLALVKRCSELVSIDKRGGGAAQGRDYRVSDLVVLWPLGVGAALSAAVVFGLFISAPETQERYATPHLLWLVVIGLIYWLGRLWIKTSRGEMHDDPVVYAIKDFASRATIIAMIAVVLSAHFLALESIQ